MVGLSALSPRLSKQVVVIIEYVAENFSDEISLTDLAAVAGVTKFTLCRSFERSFGTTVMQWLWKVRIRLARYFLDASLGGRLTDVAVLCGFNSSAHFSRSFRRHFSVAPSKWQKAQTSSAGTDLILAEESLRAEVQRIAMACLSKDAGI